MLAASQAAAVEPQANPVEPQPAPANPAASPADAYLEFRRDYAAGRYVEALPHARRVLQQAEQGATDPTAEEVQVALMNLGMTQNLTEDFIGAEETYQRVIKLIQSSGRPLHARLARAYAGLATAYHDTQRHELAVKNFDQAIALTRRHVGLLDDRQVPLVEKYIDSLTELGRYEEGLQAQKYLLRIATRKYGENSIEITPRLEEIGRWYATAGAYDQSRRILKQAFSIIEAAEGAQSQRLVSPLLALAACNRRQLLDPVQQQQGADAERASRYSDPSAAMVPMGYTPAMMLAEGERALLRAAAITDAAATPSLEQVVKVRTQLGDWYQLRLQTERAVPHYQQAWTAAAKVTARLGGKPYTEAIFGSPVLLYTVRPEGWNRYAGRPPDTLEVRTVVVEATIDASGRATDPKIVDDSGDAKRAERTVRALTKSARYRPRFEKGEPVATTGVKFEQPWVLLLPTVEPGKETEAKPVAPAADATSAQPDAAPPASDKK